MSEHTDSARLEATRDAIRTGTAPRPRVEGEAMTEVRWKFIRHAVTYPGFVGDRDLFFYAARDAVRECDRLTAEVERLTKEKAEAVAIARDAANTIGRVCDSAGCEVGDWCIHAERIRDRIALLAALALPTPAPEATNDGK